MINTPLNIRNFSKYPVVDVYHPSVVYVKEGWNGHKFWMVQTPYSIVNIEPYNDRYELPCVLFSDDGIQWRAIPNNPIDDLSTEDIEAHNYLSDPHLILKDGVLELYYRYTILKDKQLEGNKTVLCRKTSKNGIEWSEREIITDLREPENVEVWGEQIISPAIVWKGNRYYCWYIDASGYVQNRHVRMTTSANGIHWEKNKVCVLPNNEVIPWHIDVQFYDGRYQILLYDTDNQFLVHYTSLNGLTFENENVLLRPTHKLYDYYSDSLYRACSVKEEERIDVYISGHNGERCSIGLWATKDFSELKPINGMNVCSYICEYKIAHKCYMQFRSKLRPIKRIIKMLLCK